MRKRIPVAGVSRPSLRIIAVRLSSLMPTLLTIGHSYVVGQNRRLAHEMAMAGAGEWQVTAVAPVRFAGDLRCVDLEPLPHEACELVPLDVRLRSSRHLFLYRNLAGVLRRRWDIVHCWEEPYVAAGAQVAALLPRGARLVPATFQNLVKRYPPPFRQLERFVMDRASGWVAFGESIRDAHRRRPRYAARPVRVIPPGVDLNSFKPDHVARAEIRRRLGWHDDRPVIGFVGRFVAEKGIGVLMRVLPQIKSRWRALFVGGGPLQADLERFAAAHDGRVHLVTTADHDRVPAYLNAMDLLCAPSQTTTRWREQFGRMLIEAMACGVPIIASRSGEIPYVLGDAGTLLPEDDDAAWVQAIEAVLADEECRSQFAARGLARARTRYGWPLVASAHLAFFRELLAA